MRKRADSLILRNVEYLDASSATWETAESILIHDGTIVEVCNSHLEVEGVSSIDLRGRFAIPGMIDTHVHISEDPGRKAQMFTERTTDASIKLLRENGATALDFGITTVRDMGSCSGNLAKFFKEGTLSFYEMPEIIHCGKVITYGGGHMLSCGVAVDDMQQVREVISENVELGAAFTKVTSDPEDVEAAGKTPNPAFSKRFLQSLVEFSESVNLPVACHTFPSVEGVSTAIASNVRTVEHAAPLTDAQLEQAKLAGTVFVPTLVAAFDDMSPEFTIGRYGLDESAMELWDKIAGDYSRRKLTCTPPKSIITWVDRVWPRLRLAYSENIPIVPGSDAGCPGTTFGSLLREIRILSMFADKPIDVVCAATFGASMVLGRPDLGRIKVGAKGNFVVLSDNLEGGLEGLATPVCVIMDGRVVRGEHKAQGTYHAT